jgi:hypothetical protein
MNNLRSITLFLMLLSLPLIAQANGMSSFRIWTAFHSGQTIMTNYDIENYICETTLTDNMMISLFKEAGGDYDKYDILRRQYAQQRFKDGLRQYAYVYSMQKVATSKLHNREGRKAFKISERDFSKRVEEFETKTLKKWLDQRQGIVKARKAFGSELKPLGYPHKLNSSNTDLYFEWFDLQKKRIKENLRLNELQKFEYISALGYKREFYVRPVEIFDFKKEIEGKIEDQLQRKRLTGGQLEEIIQTDTRLPVLLKNVELLGPDSTELAKLEEIAPNVYADFHKNIEDEVLTKLSGKLTQDILRYDRIVGTLVDKYNDQEKLLELSKEMNEKFLLGTGDFNHFMMARLYKMAAIRLQQGESFKGNSNTSNQKKSAYLKNLMDSTNEILTQALKNSKDLGSSRLEDHFITQLSTTQDKSLSEQLIEDDYLRQFRIMANWVVKFQIKKASLNTTPLCLVETYDARKWEGQDRIEKHLKNKFFNDSLDQFRRDKMRSIGPYIRINPTGDYSLDQSESWNYVLEKFKK